MRNFQETFKTPRRSLISAFSIGMTVPSKSSNQKFDRVPEKLAACLCYNIITENSDKIPMNFRLILLFTISDKNCRAEEMKQTSALLNSLFNNVLFICLFTKAFQQNLLYVCQMFKSRRSSQ